MAVKNDDVLPIRLPKELKKAFLNIADQKDLSASQIIREMIRRYLQDNSQMDLFSDKKGGEK